MGLDVWADTYGTRRKVAGEFRARTIQHWPVARSDRKRSQMPNGLVNPEQLRYGGNA